MSRGVKMISYEPFWNTLKQKNISTYALTNDYNISNSLMDRIRHNGDLKLSTINKLCKVLDCEIGDIVKYIKDEE